MKYQNSLTGSWGSDVVRSPINIIESENENVNINNRQHSNPIDRNQRYQKSCEFIKSDFGYFGQFLRDDFDKIFTFWFVWWILIMITTAKTYHLKTGLDLTNVATIFLFKLIRQLQFTFSSCDHSLMIARNSMQHNQPFYRYDPLINDAKTKMILSEMAWSKTSIARGKGQILKELFIGNDL